MGTVKKITGVESNNRASEAGAAAANKQFNIAQDQLNPFIEFGKSQMSGLQDLINNPDSIADSAQYKFTRDQGLEGINRTASAAGFRGSGNVMYDLTKYASGLASKTYSDEFNRRYGLVQLGQSSASALAGASVTTGNTLANVFSNQGNTSASAMSAGAGGMLGMGAAAISAMMA